MRFTKSLVFKVQTHYRVVVLVPFVVLLPVVWGLEFSQRLPLVHVVRVY